MAAATGAAMETDDPFLVVGLLDGGFDLGHRGGLVRHRPIALRWRSPRRRPASTRTLLTAPVKRFHRLGVRLVADVVRIAAGHSAGYLGSTAAAPSGAGALGDPRTAEIHGDQDRHHHQQQESGDDEGGPARRADGRSDRAWTAAWDHPAPPHPGRWSRWRGRPGPVWPGGRPCHPASRCRRTNSRRNSGPVPPISPMQLVTDTVTGTSLWREAVLSDCCC